MSMKSPEVLMQKRQYSVLRTASKFCALTHSRQEYWFNVPELATIGRKCHERRTSLLHAEAPPLYTRP